MRGQMEDYNYHYEDGYITICDFCNHPAPVQKFSRYGKGEIKLCRLCSMSETNGPGYSSETRQIIKIMAQMMNTMIDELTGRLPKDASF